MKTGRKFKCINLDFEKDGWEQDFKIGCIYDEYETHDYGGRSIESILEDGYTILSSIQDKKYCWYVPLDSFELVEDNSKTSKDGR